MYKNLSSISAGRRERTAFFGMACAELRERAGIEHNVNADSMLAAEVNFSDRKANLRVVGVSAVVVDGQVSSRAVLRTEMPKRRWKKRSQSKSQKECVL
jgi:hypothetical protein